MIIDNDSQVNVSKEWNPGWRINVLMQWRKLKRELCGVDLDVYLVLIKQICRYMFYIWVKWKTRPNFVFPITTNILELDFKPDRVNNILEVLLAFRRKNVKLLEAKTKLTRPHTQCIFKLYPCSTKTVQFVINSWN